MGAIDGLSSDPLSVTRDRDPVAGDVDVEDDEPAAEGSAVAAEAVAVEEVEGAFAFDRNFLVTDKLLVNFFGAT